MLLADSFDEHLSSTVLIGAGGKTSDFGQIFASYSHVSFYFHHENVHFVHPIGDNLDSGRVQQYSKPCQLFLEQAKVLVENLRGIANGDGSNAKNSKSISGHVENGCLAVIFVSILRNNEVDQGFKMECAVGHGLREDFVWILPLKEKQAQVLLLRTYKVRSTPAFVVVDGKTKRTIARDGRRALQADPQGRRFPWHLPEPADVFQGKLIKKLRPSGDSELVDVDELRGAVKCLLFAAHWCPPCRSFVKQLSQTYRQLQENRSGPLQFELIFCSMDRCEDTFKQFYSEMPWLTFPYSDPRCIAAARLYNVQEIPTLLVLDSENQLITRHGKCELSMDPAGREFPWYPKVVLELNYHTASRLREDISFLLFTEGASEDLVFAQTSLLPVAEEFCVRSSSDQQDVVFFYCGDDPICDQVWDGLALGDASMPLICIVDPFTDSLYVCDDPNVSEVIIRRFIEKFFTGDLEPTRRLNSSLIVPASRGNFALLNSPQQPSVSFVGGNNDSSVCAKMTGEPDRISSGGSKRLCVNTGGIENTNMQQRYCL